MQKESSMRSRSRARLAIFCIAATLGVAGGLALRPVIHADGDNLIVTVTGGRIRGASLQSSGAVFKGVPYAQSPVNDLRWREPLPVRPWTDVRDALAFGPACLQAGGSIFSAPATTFSEDCLYLNIWTTNYPVHGQQPVMLWIHGGGNRNGDGGQQRFDGEQLAHRGVVVVTINFRLGAFGFFAHPALTAESAHHASGNQGLLDQVAALKWIRDNIAVFGGDPSNVTLFGQSSGARDVSVLLTSPLTKGLLRRAIVQSTAVGPNVGDVGPLTLAQAETRGQAFMAALGVSGAVTADRLRALPAADIVRAPAPGAGAYMSVIVDGFVVPRAPFSVFAAGGQHRVDLIIGNTTRDGIPTRVPLVDVKGAIERAYGVGAERAVSLYGVRDQRSRDPDPVYGTAAEQWISDTQFRCPAIAQSIWHARAGNRVYEYEFGRVPHGRERMGATHSSELPYLFANFDAPGEFATAAYDASDPTSDAMQEYWANFAKTGDPNGGRLPKWPSFELSSRAFLSFTQDGPRARAGLRRSFCDLYIEYVRRVVGSVAG
jgi:para-nitrobenzyl esterase